MRRIAGESLREMYRPREGLFVFRKKLGREGVEYEGFSLRYTAIALIALAGETPGAAEGICGGQALPGVYRRLAENVFMRPGMGDLALALWAAGALGIGDRGDVREALRQRMARGGPCPTVEAAWALKALCVDDSAAHRDLRDQLAKRLVAAFNPRAGLFPHHLEGRSVRRHVTCLADQVYAIQALAAHHRRCSKKKSLQAASRCAEKICELQGPQGQWWWHYALRTGTVVEGYPVYSVHQDAMAPMALLELKAAGGPNFSPAVALGVSWMQYAPEIHGSLIDEAHGAIWRKVDRRGPRKLCRYAQAAVARLHGALRIRALDRLFKPGRVDYECRPYHLAWLLYAWPEKQNGESGG
jgi:hypothetical protein